MISVKIFSELSDQSTTKIMKWIIGFGGEVDRINIDDTELEILLLSSNYLRIKTRFSRISFTKHDTVWFRRASYFSTFITEKVSEKILRQKSFAFNEKREIFDTIIKWVKSNCKFVADPDYSHVNKIEVLRLAHIEGIICPDWIITNNRETLLEFAKGKKHLASKSFTSLMYDEGDYFYKNIVKQLSVESLDTLPPHFQNTIFQDYIEKKYELRIFFWMNHLFSMAIFSQGDEMTRVDFRNYNLEKPNRCIPVKLDQEFQSKLISLARLLKLDTGSFDVLVTHNDTFVFLEVNPVGQFGMVSHPCNYYIEKFIAKSLLAMA